MKPPTDLVVEACQVLKHTDARRFAPVIRFLLAEELEQRKAPRRRPAQRKVTLRTKSGRRVELYAGDVKRMEGEQC